MKSKPNLFCIGAQKAGTSALCAIFKQSSEIFFSNEKEIHYFDDPDNFSKGSSWYLNFFDTNSEFKYYADFTPDYLNYDYVPKRLFEFTDPNTKFIVMLRNPVDRAYSQFQFFRSFNAEKSESYLEAFDNDEADIKKNKFRTLFDPKYYIDRGRYAKQLKRYLRYFKFDQFKFIIYEEFRDNPQKVVAEICRFLDINQFTFRQSTVNQTRTPKNQKISEVIRSKKPLKRKAFSVIRKILPARFYNGIKLSIYYSVFRPPKPMNQKARKQIFMKYYQNEIEDLEKLIHKDLSIWRESFK